MDALTGWTNLSMFRLLPQLAEAGLQGAGLHMLAGAASICWLLVLCKLGELFGSEECTTAMSPGRRLPYDSDLKLSAGLIVIGGLVGGVVASVCGQFHPQVGSVWWASAAVCALLGMVIPLPLIKVVANGYLERARLNLSEENYRDAIEDATEVARLSLTHKEEALRIKSQALEQRNQAIGQLRRESGGLDTLQQQVIASVD